jgi:repressor LexA
MRTGLSERQREILRFIRAYWEEYGRPPTNREIGEAIGVRSTGHVDYHLRMLEQKGYLQRDPNTSRGLRPGPRFTEAFEETPAPTHGRAPLPLRDVAPRLVPLPPQHNVVSLPIVGTIAAGEPIEAVADPTETVQIGADLAQEGDYVLRVKGSSMIEDHILDGDLVVVRPQSTARNGDVVVALLLSDNAPEGEATLKRFYHEGTRIRLQPANSDMDPIYVDPRELVIQGRVITLVRRLH